MGSADRYEQLLRNLIERTESGTVKWVLSERRPDAYEHQTSKATLVCASRDGDGAPPFEFQIRNKEGDLLEAFGEWTPQFSTKELIQLIPQLYIVARRQALGVDRIVDDIFQELGPDEASF